MATSGKGGYRNNGRPRIQLKRGWTRVAQLKAALRELRQMVGDVRRPFSNVRIIESALDGTYTDAR